MHLLEKQGIITTNRAIESDRKGEIGMKVSNIKDIEKFFEVIEMCIRDRY